jgi:hypothetical protein
MYAVALYPFTTFQTYSQRRSSVTYAAVDAVLPPPMPPSTPLTPSTSFKGVDAVPMAVAKLTP